MIRVSHVLEYSNDKKKVEAKKNDGQWDFQSPTESENFMNNGFHRDIYSYTEDGDTLVSEWEKSNEDYKWVRGRIYLWV